MDYQDHRIKVLIIALDAMIDKNENQAVATMAKEELRGLLEEVKYQCSRWREEVRRHDEAIKLYKNELRGVREQLEQERQRERERQKVVHVGDEGYEALIELTVDEKSKCHVYKIGAIKDLRKRTGVGLKLALDSVNYYLVRERAHRGGLGLRVGEGSFMWEDGQVLYHNKDTWQFGLPVDYCG